MKTNHICDECRELLEKGIDVKTHTVTSFNMPDTRIYCEHTIPTKGDKNNPVSPRK
jgi:hypothetical protein